MLIELGMTKKRRDLTPEELLWAKNLNTLWQQRPAQPNGKKISQAKAAELAGWAGQSTVSQYINGEIPINTNAILKFCALIPCEPKDIDPNFGDNVIQSTQPQLVQELSRLAEEAGPEHAPGLIALARAYVQQVKAANIGKN
jgi:transcriptional regulator with XRE-family HTH domain